MTPNAQQLVKHLFDADSLDDVPLWQLRELVSEYPYYNVGHYLLSKKLMESNHEEQLEAAKTASLHFTNPFWLRWVLEYKKENDLVTPAADPIVKNVDILLTTIEETVSIPPTVLPKPEEEKREVITEETLLFEPYHTIDYFASQGIRLTVEDIPKDRFGQQLKSFTDWLKTMKKLPQQESPVNDDEVSDAVIRDIANHSNEEKEILTEAMADVLAKQGKHDKARDLYQKLSLQNPAKSAYFAAKIDQLKAI